MIKISRLTYSVKSQKIFDNLDLRIESGSFSGLIGENGSGKTTLLRIIQGLINNYKGEIKIQNGVTLNYQPESTDKRLNVNIPDYLFSYAVIYQVDLKKRLNRIEKVMELLDLKKESGKKLKELSKGFLQRLSLARCLLNEPDLIILDEPFSNIDAESREKIIESLIKLRGKTTVLISSHNLDEIKQLCDRIWKLNELKCVEITADLI